jgi:hypothetical protein
MELYLFFLVDYIDSAIGGNFENPNSVREQEVFFNPGTDYIDFFLEDTIWLYDLYVFN